ncbi:MAG: hypothetical protein ACRDRN_24345 [Sciscionella sp.]
MTRYLSVLAGLLVLLAAPTASLASGGDSIADAPTLVYGQVTAGGGLREEFWRMQLYESDRVTFTADLGVEGQILGGTQEYGFTLYAPSVTDYNIRSASAATEAAPIGGKNEFVLKSPFSGLGTLDVCQGNLEADNSCGEWWDLDPEALPYSFTATISHATTLTVSTPSLARRGSRVTVRARVQSPAGTPEGACLIHGAEAPLDDGQCAKRIRLGRGSRQTVRVAFVPNQGWQGASAHRTILLAR